MPMLCSLKVEQYKSLKRVEWEPGPVSILIGPNASGKSNLIDALRFLHEAVSSDVETAVGRRGGFENLLFQGERWGDRFIISLHYQPTDRSREPLRYHVQIADASTAKDTVAPGTPGIREEYLSRILSAAEVQSLFIAGWGRGTLDLNTVAFDTGDTSVLGIKAVGFLDQHPDIRELRAFIEGWQFLQVDLTKIREPQRDRRALHLLPDGSNLANVLRTLSAGNPGKLDEIVADVRSLLAHVESLQLEVERGQVTLLLKEHGFARAFDPLALSDGTLRLLVLVTAVHTMPEQGLLCIEEPEHGLHPLLFGPLLDLIRERCPDGGSRQIVMTTHSPDLVDAAEPQEVVPVERAEDGSTELRVLDQDKLKQWLEEFRLGELWRMRQIGAVP